MSDFISVKPVDFSCKPFSLISSDWLLITAEKEGRVNTMTASWGGLGHIWGKHSAFFFIRPQRFTKGFVDAQDKVSLSVLPGSFRDALNYLGTASGRDEDKIAKSGLTVLRQNGTPYFKEAETVFICRKMYAQPFEENCFTDKKALEENYPERDLHTLYIAEIEEILRAAK
jgi:flavin reductase (DIM6/NTAB) family NADH-FMN oxidoreductase RutF